MQDLIMIIIGNFIFPDILKRWKLVEDESFGENVLLMIKSCILKTLTEWKCNYWIRDLTLYIKKSIFPIRASLSVSWD